MGPPENQIIICKHNQDSYFRNLRLKQLSLSVLLSSVLLFSLKGQEVRPDTTGLILADKGNRIENSISLFTSRSKYELIKSITGNKTDLPVNCLIINGDTLDAAGISTRGQTTLNFRRKGYSFNLKSKASFRHRGEKESLRKFYALSLCMDRDYINNRLAFEMMEKAHIFSLFYSFSELHINGNDEGIYMIIERPEDWAMKKKNSRFLIRRGYNQNIDKTETDNNTSKEEIRKYLYDYRQIYRYLNRLEGKALYDTISTYLDIDSYMKWLAFNFFVRNGDYTDEVWFYFNPEIRKFSIIPWDYDDLFFAAPHEGANQGRNFAQNRLIFSTEDLLDKKIAGDPFLYKVYLKQFRELMGHLSEEVIKKAFEHTYSELCPYYKCREIILMSEYDAYGATDQEKLRSDMVNLFLILRNSRNRCINYIKADI